jgi:hypothetical protein
VLALEGVAEHVLSRPSAQPVPFCLAWFAGRAAAISPVRPEAGLYKYDYQEGAERARVHLRIDPDGSGILLVNASRVMHLNPSAVPDDLPELRKNALHQAIGLIRRVYQVSKSQAGEDYVHIRNQLAELVRPDGLARCATWM